MGRISYLTRPPPLDVRMTPTGPTVKAGAKTAEQALVTTRAVFDRVLSETGSVPDLDFEHDDAPADAIF